MHVKSDKNGEIWQDAPESIIKGSEDPEPPESEEDKGEHEADKTESENARKA